MSEQIDYPIRAEQVDELIKAQDTPRGRLTLTAHPNLVRVLDNLTGAGTQKYKGVELIEDDSLAEGEAILGEKDPSSNKGKGGD